MPMRYRKQAMGIGLLELMLVIALIAIITLLSVSYFQSVSSNQKITQANSLVADIYVASKDYVKAQGMDQLSLDNLISAGLLTDYYREAPWGGQVTVTPSSSMNHSITQIKIEMSDVPPAECIKLRKRLLKTIAMPSSVKNRISRGNSVSDEEVKCSKSSESKQDSPSISIQVLYDLY